MADRFFDVKNVRDIHLPIHGVKYAGRYPAQGVGFGDELAGGVIQPAAKGDLRAVGADADGGVGSPREPVKAETTHAIGDPFYEKFVSRCGCR